jgi:hypothetical protein
MTYMRVGRKVPVMTSYEESHFSREGVVDIDAAVVGVSQARWEQLLESESTKEKAAEIMRHNRFDILPVVSGEEVKAYFRTDKWNDYSNVSEETIKHCDVIPFHTHIRDVIKGFALESRNFYFLHSEHRIVGLISVVNLNCRQVKVYLFSLISELEVRLSHFITEHVAEETLLNMTFGRAESTKYEEPQKRFQHDRANGIDLPLVEYLYLSDLIKVIIEQRLCARLGYTPDRFRGNFFSLNDLRHAVAHPTRSIVTHEYSAKQLWEKIDRVEEALFVFSRV